MEFNNPMKTITSILGPATRLRVGLQLAGTCLTLLYSGPVAAGTIFRDCPDCPTMVVVPAGSFEMGYVPTDENPETDAAPVHTVVIKRDFAVGAYEITRADFKRFATSTEYISKDECNIYETDWWFVKKGISWRNPGYDQTENDPVVCVTWYEAQEYIKWLCLITGFGYRLLSEAEWEYVAKTGSAAQDADKISHDNANYGAVKCCGPKRGGLDHWDYTAPVGSFEADSLGLYDIRGNVWEWLSDCYHENYEGAPTDGSPRLSDCSAPESRVVRGGSWGDDVFYLRTAYRLRGPAENGYFTLGFRVARSLD